MSKNTCISTYFSQALITNGRVMPPIIIPHNLGRHILNCATERLRHVFTVVENVLLAEPKIRELHVSISIQ